MKIRTRLSGDDRRFSSFSNPPRRGSILIACLIILATLTVYGGVLISVVYERSLNINLEVDRLQALYLAEAGLASALQEVKTLKDKDGETGHRPTPDRLSGLDLPLCPV